MVFWTQRLCVSRLANFIDELSWSASWSHSEPVKSQTRIHGQGFLLDATSAMRALPYAGRFRSARNIDLPLTRDLRVIL